MLPVERRFCPSQRSNRTQRSLRRGTGLKGRAQRTMCCDHGPFLEFQTVPVRLRRRQPRYQCLCTSVRLSSCGEVKRQPPPRAHQLWQIQHDGRKAKMTARLYLTGLISVFIWHRRPAPPTSAAPHCCGFTASTEWLRSARNGPFSETHLIGGGRLECRSAAATHP